jgi:CubicO group peptidase (beta-lactamase class C family)
MGTAENETITSVLADDRVFDRLITLLMHLGHFPSVSACIVLEDEVVWSKGYGLYDLDNEKPATDQTIYMACSVSKTITGTALMQLYDQGLFELDDDVNLYLPFSLRNPNFPDTAITFRMLLSHSSSLRSDPPSFYWFNFSEYPPFTWYPYPWIASYLVPGGAYYVPEIWSTVYQPGEQARYANANFVVIAFLIEILSGASFIDYCEDHVFNPLDMDVSSFSLGEVDIDQVAIPYQFFRGRYLTITELEWGELSPPPDIYYTGLHYPVGGLYTSVMELSHFLIAHMNGGLHNDTRILEETTVEEMHTLQPPKTRYGLAWYYSGTRYGRVFSGHEGDVPGYHNSMFMQHPDLDIGVIYFINGDRYSMLGGGMALLLRNILFLKANILHHFSQDEGYESDNDTKETHMVYTPRFKPLQKQLTNSHVVIS